jgi:uncharacterized membrane protein YdjX (TVP38/TMEM64 family)
MSVVRSGGAIAISRNRPWVWVGLALLVVAVAGAAFVLPVGDWITVFEHWIRGLGFWGVAIFALLFVATTVVLAPDWPLSIAGGFVYGFWALPVVLVAATVAATLAFLAGRYLLRDRVRRFLVGRPKLAAIDRTVAEDGWKIVALLRLSPAVPFNLQNYLFGVTAVPLLDYVAATAVGIVPASAFYVYLGALGNAARHEGSGRPLKFAMLGIGLVATVAVAVLVARKARAKLEAAARQAADDIGI